jgi:hypothetical protein
LRSTLAVPAAIADAGDHGARRSLEFFAVNIRNKNTRLAYYGAVCQFFAWVEQHKIGELADIGGDPLLDGGTDGSNPASSSEESIANLSIGANPIYSRREFHRRR